MYELYTWVLLDCLLFLKFFASPKDESSVLSKYCVVYFIFSVDGNSSKLCRWVSHQWCSTLWSSCDISLYNILCNWGFTFKQSSIIICVTLYVNSVIYFIMSCYSSFQIQILCEYTLNNCHQWNSSEYKLLLHYKFHSSSCMNWAEKWENPGIKHFM